jgi:hypothetical protein
MKAKCLMMTAVLGMLAASSANAWQFNYGTYIKRHAAPVQPAASQAKTEVQVAVLANSPVTDIKTLCPTVSIWYGYGASTHATHSH